jgi:hypothetical protein
MVRKNLEEENSCATVLRDGAGSAENLKSGGMAHQLPGSSAGFTGAVRAFFMDRGTWPFPQPSAPSPLLDIVLVIAASGILAGGGFMARRWWIRRQNPALFREYD